MTRRGRDGGQASLEYVGIVLLVAVLLSAVVTVSLAPGIQATYQRAYCLMATTGACEADPGSGPGPSGGTSAGPAAGDRDHAAGGVQDFLGGLGHFFASTGKGIASIARKGWDWYERTSIGSGIVDGFASDVKGLVDYLKHPITNSEAFWSYLKQSWHTLEGGMIDRMHHGDYWGAFGYELTFLGKGALDNFVVDDGVKQAWKDGKYPDAIGRVVWNVGSWFIPGGAVLKGLKGLKIAEKAGKLGSAAAKAAKAAKAAARAARIAAKGADEARAAAKAAKAASAARRITDVEAAAARAERAARAAEKLARERPSPASRAAAKRARKAADEAERTRVAATPRTVRLPDGRTVPGVPKGAKGVLSDNAEGYRYQIPPGTPGLDPRVTEVRVMDPLNTGRHHYPRGYIVYMNAKGQTIDPTTGRTVSKKDPLAHIPR